MIVITFYDLSICPRVCQLRRNFKFDFNKLDKTNVRVFVFGKSQFGTLQERQRPWWGLRKFYKVGEYLDSSE